MLTQRAGHFFARVYRATGFTYKHFPRYPPRVKGRLKVRLNLNLCCNCLVPTAAWKIFLLCLMLVAIPLQGFAGVSAGVCAGHGAGLPTLSIAKSHHNADAMVHHAHAAGHADSGKAVAEPVHFKCSACGSCCLGAAIHAFAPAPALQTPQQANFADPSYHHLSPALGGLDRPPQITRA